jgi:putative flavoprotein involved in K+ transport
MKRITTVIMGAGQSGLAFSKQLSDRAIDHVVLERGEVAHTWRTERLDSLRLLTPNWQTRLPGHAYDGDDPDGYMDMPQVVDFLKGYAGRIAAPVESRTTVRSVRRSDNGFIVATDRGDWACRSVVLASGPCNVATVPKFADALPDGIAGITPMDYRNPGQLADGGVMVVGASASGIQLAKEIHESGRPVTISVGEHVRVPRVYRGRDIKWWMDVTGVMDMGYDEVDGIDRARRVASLQLVGTPERTTLDLNTLRGAGVGIVGRLAGISDGRTQFSGSLGNVCDLADLKMDRLLDTIDEWVDENGDDGFAPSHRFAPTEVDADPPLGMDLTDSGIKTVVWATGYRPDYSWLDVPVLDRKGRIRHDGGVVTDAPGMYVMGLPFLRRRKSSFIDGVGDDAAFLAQHLCAGLYQAAAA